MDQEAEGDGGLIGFVQADPPDAIVATQRAASAPGTGQTYKRCPPIIGQPLHRIPPLWRRPASRRYGTTTNHAAAVLYLYIIQP